MSPWPVRPTARRRLERVLEVHLPAAVRSVEHVRWAPVKALSLSVDFARLRLPLEDARALTRTLGLRPRGHDGLTDFYLGTGWQAAPEHAPPWWPADPDDLADQAASARGEHGWTVAGYRRPYLYLLTTAAAAPGSDVPPAAPGVG